MSYAHSTPSGSYIIEDEDIASLVEELASMITPETELKQKYVVSCFDIFRFAEKEFGTHWNACCEMFHTNEVLTYKQTDDIDMTECLHQYEGMGAGLTDIAMVCTDFISNMIVCDDKAYLILAKFMHANKVERMLVTND